MVSDPRRLPTLPVLVEIQLETKRQERVTLFLSMASASREGPETLDDFLNTPRRLLPVAHVGGDKPELLSRDAVVSVRVMSEIAPSSDNAVAPAVDLVRAELSSGEVIDGAVRHGAESRLSDFFNAAPDFFALEDERGVVYVNKRHVISITM
jgi:hypothetical protein